MDLLSATLTLILIMDPLGNIPMFLSILNKIPDENRRRKILIRELLLLLLVLLIFLFLGRHLLNGSISNLNRCESEAGLSFF